MKDAPATPSPTPARSEVQTRVWMGLVMTTLVAGVLVADQHLASWVGRPIYPCLLLVVVLLVLMAGRELHALLSAHSRPPLWLMLGGCLAVALAGWPAQVGWTEKINNPWRDTAWTFAAVVLAGFLWEMAAFREPGGVVNRLSLLTWAVGYLGLLPAFFVQVRFWPEGSPALAGVAALTLVIFVPKGADVGAFFTGRALGKHRMTPRLSPKKTWEGLAGGLALAMLVAVGVQNWLAPVFGGYLEAAAFGLVVGVAGVLGDLAESLIKRDCLQKDASRLLPGFGGFLDVVDSVLFAAPVAYWWLLT